MKWHTRAWLGESEQPVRVIGSDDGGYRIVGPVDEPGFKGYKLFEGIEHVATHRKLYWAKLDAEERARRALENV